MYRIIALLMVWSSIACSFSLFSGEGDLKIKASTNKSGIEKSVQGLEIFLDGKNMGETQGGFVTFKIEEGKHKVVLKDHNKKMGYYKVYMKNIVLQPKSIIEIIFDITTKLEFELDESRKINTKKLFEKYNLVGTWKSDYIFDNTSELKSLTLKVLKNASWEIVMKEKIGDSNSLNTLLSDNGTNLQLIENHSTQPINIKYPTIKDDCFEFEMINDKKDILQMCRIKKMEAMQKEKYYNYILNVIANGSNSVYPDELPGGMPPGMASGKAAEESAHYIASGLKGKAPDGFNVCTGCHGMHGEGIPSVGAKLTDAPLLGYKLFLINKKYK